MLRFICSLLFGLLGFTGTMAVTVPHLFTTDVAVPSQGPEYRAPAILHAFKQVLVRSTGQPEVLKSSVVENALGHARDYLIDYGYRHPQGVDASPGSIEMFARFNPTDIKALIKKANFPLWGRDRPLVLVWLAVAYQNQAPVLLGQDSVDSALTNLKQQVHVLGLPMILPALDVVDDNKITVQDIWKMNYAAILNASSRYGSNVALAIKLSEIGEGKWLASADVFLNNNVFPLSVSASSANKALRTMVTKATGLIAKDYVNAASNLQSQITLTIDNVHDVLGYAAVLKYLRGFSEIQDLQVQRVANNQVQLVLSINGGLKAFENLTGLDNKLVLESSDETSNNTSRRYFFKWNVNQ